MPAVRRSFVLAVLLIVAVVPRVHASDFTNFETPQVHPIALSPDSQWLAVCNTADNRVELFDLSSGTPVSAFAVFVGIDPVSVRFRTNTELWVVNQISDSVSVVDLTARVVIDTIATLDEPADVVFAGNPQMAWVSCSQMNTIQKFDPANRAAAPTNIVIKGEDPRALAVSPDGATVYVAVFESGNGSTILGGSNETLTFPSSNPVNHSSGPYGGVNPPPNDGASFKPAKSAGLPTPPRVGMIVKRNAAGQWMDDNNGNWTTIVTGGNATAFGHRPGWVLLDHDVARINTTTNAVSYTDGLMNINMAIGVNPATGDVHVVGTDATNEIRFEPNLTGTFVRVKHAQFTTTAPTAPTANDLNPHLTYLVSNIPPTERNKSIGDPRAMAWRQNGSRGFVAGMGSNNLVVIDASGARAGFADTIPVGQGPTGIAVDETRAKLDVLNRFEGTVSIVDLASETETSRVAFFDPTPAAIRDGRSFLFNTHETSGLGQVACASCHVDTRMDRLAWDLGDPSAFVKEVNVPAGRHNLGAGISGFSDPTAFDDFHPMKGPMVTQTLQHIIGLEPFHFRGDKDGLEEFNGAFPGLQGADGGLGPEDMQKFEDYLATIHFPPNPYRNLDNTLPTNLPLPGHFRTKGAQIGQQLPNGNAQTALVPYRQFSLDACGGGAACVTCHTLPTRAGTDSRTTNQTTFFPLAPGPLGERHLSLVPGVGASQHVVKNVHLRNMYDRVGFDATQAESTAGFGFFHDGSMDSLARFMEQFNSGQVGSDQQVANMVALMLAFSGSDFGAKLANREPPGPPSQDAHAAVGKQVTISDPDADPDLGMLSQFLALAESGKVDLVAKSIIEGAPRGWQFLPGGGGSNPFQTDRANVTENLATITARATLAIPVTFTVVVHGDSTRIGIDRDRDRDGLLDDDEFRDLLPDIPGWQNPFAANNADVTGNNGAIGPDGVPDGQNDFDGDGTSNAAELLAGNNPVGNLVASPPLVAHVILVDGGSSIIVEWASAPLGEYVVQYSHDLLSWTNSPTGGVKATVAAGTLQWSDAGPDATPSAPNTVPRRFYRVVRTR